MRALADPEDLLIETLQRIAGTTGKSKRKSIFCLTGQTIIDSLRKFAQKCSATSSRAAARLRFPDPSGPLRRFPAWIFDNQVEHASREDGEDLGLILLTMLVLRSHFERCEGDCSGDLRRPVAIIRFQTRV